MIHRSHRGKCQTIYPKEFRESHNLLRNNDGASDDERCQDPGFSYLLQVNFHNLYGLILLVKLDVGYEKGHAMDGLVL